MLEIQLLPYNELKNLDPKEKINKILHLVKNKKIVLINGRLTEQEQALLIKETMERIDKKFSGIEPVVFYPEQSKGFIDKIKKIILESLLGYQYGLSLVGPADIIKEIKKDPNKFLVLLKENKKK